MKKSLDAILGELKEREKARERGTWKEALRQQYAPWFDDLVYGFEFKEGWRQLVTEAMEGLVQAVGGPQSCPNLRITRLRQERGRLSLQTKGLAGERREAADTVFRVAAERSLRTCERCGSPGTLRKSAQGLRYTACDRHLVKG